MAATLTPGSSVSLVARRYDVNANQVFAWRRRYRGAAAEPSGLQLMPVTVTSDHPVGMAGGYRVRVGDGVNGSTLRLVLDVLERR